MIDVQQRVDQKPDVTVLAPNNSKAINEQAATSAPIQYHSPTQAHVEEQKTAASGVSNINDEMISSQDAVDQEYEYLAQLDEAQAGEEKTKIPNNFNNVSASQAQTEPTSDSKTAAVASIEEVISPPSEVSLGNEFQERPVEDKLEDAISDDDFNWFKIFKALPCHGLLRNIASHCELVTARESAIHFRLDDTQAALYSEKIREDLSKVLNEYLGRAVELNIEVATLQSESPATREKRLTDELYQKRLKNFQEQPNIQKIVETFDGKIDANSIVSIETIVDSV